jgi:hypothetical protein
MNDIRSLSHVLLGALLPVAWCGPAAAAGMQAGSGPGGLRSPDGVPIIQVYEDPQSPAQPRGGAQGQPPTQAPAMGGWGAPEAPVSSRRRGGSGMGMGSGSGRPWGDTPEWGPAAGAFGPGWMGEPGRPGGFDSAGGYPPPPPPEPSLEYLPPEAPAFDPQFPDAETWATVPEAPASGDQGSYPPAMPGYGAFQFPPPEFGAVPVPAGEEFEGRPSGSDFGSGPPGGWPEYGPGGQPGFSPGGPWGYAPGGYPGLPPMFQPPGAQGSLSPLEQRLERIEELLEQILENQQRLLPK